MALLTSPLGDDPRLVPGDVDWLQLVVGDWQLLADLSFADLVLWYPVAVPEEPERRFVALAQARPFTSQTSLHRDIVGSRVRADLRSLVDEAWRTGRPTVTAPSAYAPDSSMRVTVWPVVREGRTIGVLTVHQNLTGQRIPSRLELVYRESATQLLTMVSRGQWPDPDDPIGGPHRGSPRVGDGLLRLTAEGRVDFATPNAVSAFRRLGEADPLEGRSLARIVTDLQDERRPIDESLPLVLTGKASARAELEVRSVSLTLRTVPLRDDTGRIGALVLLRDVTEVRRREQQLVGKDATIREIHHRVKNNLQTVGSLLRMQSRRMSSPEARRGLEQAMRRVDTIALVHETLSHGLDEHVDMDALLGRQFRLAVEVAGDGRPVQTEYGGGFGQLPSELATPLALVINELATNAVEHGTGPEGGRVGLSARRTRTAAGEWLEVRLWDSGAPAAGHPEAPAGTAGEPDAGPQPAAAGAVPGAGQDAGLGLRIVRTLVAGDLRGTIDWSPRAGGGTDVVIRAPVPER
ncbi:ATPase [Citricoccus sp. SGAir0253]|uniref:sensor histidine kinase n=1 Tax=Citricoccus sp. SGAir0253 TaxID=2567881 RepID=UPI0010CD5234|nr:PAS domain-containing sensor histidine kinase [Citricoccus sp. SGAir0253]QCU77759.1 ATPase [Citricoccus sp. SGAir0253]